MMTAVVAHGNLTQESKAGTLDQFQLQYMCMSNRICTTSTVLMAVQVEGAKYAL